MNPRLFRDGPAVFEGQPHIWGHIKGRFYYWRDPRSSLSMKWDYLAKEARREAVHIRPVSRLYFKLRNFT